MGQYEIKYAIFGNVSVWILDADAGMVEQDSVVRVQAGFAEGGDVGGEVGDEGEAATGIPFVSFPKMTANNAYFFLFPFTGCSYNLTRPSSQSKTTEWRYDIFIVVLPYQKRRGRYNYISVINYHKFIIGRIGSNPYTIHDLSIGGF